MKKRTLAQRIAGAPYILWAALFILIPLAIVVGYAFTDADGNFTLANIRQLAEYKEIFFISFEYSFIATVITLVISYPFAYLMSRKGMAAQRIMMMLVMLPMWMNLLIRTYSWMNILERNGVINNILGSLGIEPLNMIIPIYTVMSKIDKSLLESAEDLGSNNLSKLRRVILPLSMPGVISGFTMVFVPSVSTFYISQKLGGGKIMLIGDAIERQIQTSYNYNLGASLSLILMVVILVSMIIVNKFAGDEDIII